MHYDKIYPTLDLHGEYQISAKILTEEFVNDNIFLNKKKVLYNSWYWWGCFKKSRT